MTRKRETPQEYEMRVFHERAEQRDARMNETMSRRDILDGIDAVLSRLGGNPHLDDITDAFKALREAFE